MKGKRANEEHVIRVLKDAYEIGNVRETLKKTSPSRHSIAGATSTVE